MSHGKETLNDAAGAAARAEDGAGDRRHMVWLLAASAVLLIALPFMVYPIFLMKLMCFVLYASAFNLLLGYCGLLSLGHAAFFGGGAYVAALALARWGLAPELALVLGTGFAAVMGLAFGALAIRRRGIYLTMVTLGLAQLVYFVAVSSRYLGAEDGVQGVRRGRFLGVFDLGNDLTLYAVVATVFALAMFVIYRVTFSPFGRVVRAVRGNEARAQSLGIDVSQAKLRIFVLSAALSGLAGSLKALVFQIATLNDLSLSNSGEVVLMTLIGGVGTFFGPLVGAAVVVISQNYLAWLGEWVVFCQGLIFVLCVLAFREGIVGVIAKKLRKTL